MATKSLLQLVGEFYRRQGLGKAPLAVTSSQDDTVLQIWGLLNEGCEELASKWDWNELQQDLTFAHANRANYEAMDFDTDLPDWKGTIVGTFYDTQTRIPVYGPLMWRVWADMINMQVTQAQFQYRMAGGKLYIYPVPTAPTTYFFNWSYQSQYAVKAAGGGTKLWFDNDTDLTRLPYRIVLADLRWRYKKEKGMEYAEEQALRDLMVSDHFTNQGQSPDLDMGDPQPGDPNIVGPGLMIPAGSWNV
jgi:hypothetical protein